jgi:VanZ family protein
METNKRVAIGAIALVVAIIATINSGFRHEAMIVVSRLPYKDAGAHFLIMGGLAAAVCWAYADSRLAGIRLGVLGVSLILGIAVGLEELSQAFFPGRSVTLKDLLAGYLGIGLAAASVTAVRWMRGRSAGSA